MFGTPPSSRARRNPLLPRGPREKPIMKGFPRMPGRWDAVLVQLSWAGAWGHGSRLGYHPWPKEVGVEVTIHFAGLIILKNQRWQWLFLTFFFWGWIIVRFGHPNSIHELWANSVNTISRYAVRWTRYDEVWWDVMTCDQVWWDKYWDMNAWWDDTKWSKELSWDTKRCDEEMCWW